MGMGKVHGGENRALDSLKVNALQTDQPDINRSWRYKKWNNEAMIIKLLKRMKVLGAFTEYIFIYISLNGIFYLCT